MDHHGSRACMQLFFSDGQIEFNMIYCLAKVLQEFTDLKEEALPGKRNLFALSPDSVLLSEKRKRFFHTIVAKLLYLSRRARPDIITTIGFLCTRVQAPAEEDMAKLEQLMGYLLRTKNKVLV